MSERELLHDNNLSVIGVVSNVEANISTSKSGKDYVRGKISINVNDKVIDVNFFTMKLTKAGEVSKLYTTYTSLDSYIGKRVEVTGSIDDSIIVNGKEARHANTLQMRFINLMKETDVREDSATFEVSGFVNKGLTAVYDKDGNNIVDYQLSIGQTDYNQTAAKILTFHVDPSNTGAVSAINDRFTVGSTVKLSGNLDFNIETVKTEIENDFGPNTTKVTQHIRRRYAIQSGSIVNDEALQYTEEEIATLLNGTQAAENDQIAARSSTTTSNTTASNPVKGSVGKSVKLI